MQAAILVPGQGGQFRSTVSYQWGVSSEKEKAGDVDLADSLAELQIRDRDAGCPWWALPLPGEEAGAGNTFFLWLSFQKLVFWCGALDLATCYFFSREKEASSLGGG